MIINKLLNDRGGQDEAQAQGGCSLFALDEQDEEEEEEEQEVDTGLG